MRIAIKSRGTKNKTGFTHIRKTKRKLEFKMATFRVTKTYYEIISIQMTMIAILRDFQKLNQIYRYLKNQVVNKKAKKKVNQSQKMRMNGLTRCVASMLNDFTKRLGLCFLQISTFKQQPQRTISI